MGDPIGRACPDCGSSDVSNPDVAGPHTCQRCFAEWSDAPAPTPTEVRVLLDLSEYEASVITGALVEFGEHWESEQHTATYLRERVRAQLPCAWTE